MHVHSPVDAKFVAPPCSGATWQWSMVTVQGSSSKLRSVCQPAAELLELSVLRSDCGSGLL